MRHFRLCEILPKQGGGRGGEGGGEEWPYRQFWMRYLAFSVPGRGN